MSDEARGIETSNSETLRKQTTRSKTNTDFQIFLIDFSPINEVYSIDVRKCDTKCKFE